MKGRKKSKKMPMKSMSKNHMMTDGPMKPMMGKGGYATMAEHGKRHKV